MIINTVTGKPIVVTLDSAVTSISVQELRDKYGC